MIYGVDLPTDAALTLAVARGQTPRPAGSLTEGPGGSLLQGEASVGRTGYRHSGDGVSCLSLSLNLSHTLSHTLSLPLVFFVW